MKITVFLVLVTLLRRKHFLQINENKIKNFLSSYASLYLVSNPKENIRVCPKFYKGKSNALVLIIGGV